MSDTEYYTQIIEWCKNEKCPPELSKDQKKHFEKSVRNYEQDPESDILYFWMNGMRLKVVFVEKKRFDLIQNAHVNVEGQHLKKNGILYRLATEFKVHWKDLKTDVDAYLQTKCAECKKNKQKTEEIFIDRTKNWKNLIIEILGPLTVSNRGKRYICILVDPESRWIEAEPLESYDVKEISEFIRGRCSNFGWSNIYCVGMSQNFMDRLNEEIRYRAMEFEGLCWEMKDLFHEMGMNIPVVEQAQAGGARSKSVSPIKGVVNRESNDPKSIEMIYGIEFSNALNLLIPAIHRYVSQYPKLWDRNLMAAASALRDKEWPDLGHTAFYTMFASNFRKGNFMNLNLEAEDDPDELDYYKIDF